MLENRHSAPPSGWSLDAATFWRQKWLIVLMGALGLAGGVAYLISCPTTYATSLRIAIVAQGEGALPRPFLTTQAQIIHSAPIVSDAIARAKVASELGNVPIEDTLENLSVSVLPSSDVIRITYRSEAPGVGAKLCRGMVDEYRRSVEEVHRESVSESLLLLTKQDESLRKQLEELQRTYVKHRADGGFVGLDRNSVRLDAELLTQLSRQLIEARNRRIALTTAIAAAEVEIPLEPSNVAFVAEGAKPTHASTREDSTSIAMPPVVPMSVTGAKAADIEELRTRWVDAFDNARNLAHTLGPEHPLRQAANEQVKLLEQLIQRRGEQLLTDMTQELLVARQNEAEVEKLYNEERSRLKALDAFMIRDQQLLNNIERVEAQHDLTASKLSELQLSGQALNGVPTVEVRELDGEVLSEEIVWPRRTIVLAAGALIGVLLGGAVIILRSNPLAS